jgi:hypothetical protein
MLTGSMYGAITTSMYVERAGWIDSMTSKTAKVRMLGKDI